MSQFLWHNSQISRPPKNYSRRNACGPWMMRGSGAHRALMTFHHILSAKKKTTLHAWSAELGLQGLLKVGYPGMLLVADRAPCASAVPEFVKRVKRLPWQTCEVRVLEPVPEADNLLDALHAALRAPAHGASISRRSGLVQLDMLKQVTPLLRAADAPLPATIPGPWEAFYRSAMKM